jgi:hypothetical protein
MESAVVLGFTRGIMTPTIPPDLRPGYSQIQAASLLAPDSEAWEPFMRDVLKMPLSMLRAVQYAVNVKAWRLANDPLAQVRKSAGNWAVRRALSEKPAAAKGGVT